MANNKLPFGLCKEYGINLPKGAPPGDAWEALKKHGAVDRNGNTVHRSNTEYAEIIRKDNALECDKTYKTKRQQEKVLKKSGKRVNIYNSGDFPTVRLSRSEYAHVMSELATNMTKEERAEFLVRKAIGNYYYFVENHGFGDYRIIKRMRIVNKIRGEKKK